MTEKIPASGDIEVFISRTVDDVVSLNLENPYAAIVPDGDNWNDYGRGYFAWLIISDALGTLNQMHLRIMFVGYP